MYHQIKAQIPPVAPGPAATPASAAAGEPRPQEAEAALNPWMPRSWREEIMGCVFLPRMLEKGRRVLECKRQGRDLMNGYLFGDFDYADGMLLRFLRTNEARVVELLRRVPEDVAVAGVLISESGRTRPEIDAWSRRFRRINAAFTAMWDADEGRRKPGLGTSLLRGLYNVLLMPPVYLAFRIAVGLRRLRRNR